MMNAVVTLMGRRICRPFLRLEGAVPINSNFGHFSLVRIPNLPIKGTEFSARKRKKR
jgi:hypothetical protein